LQSKPAFEETTCFSVKVGFETTLNLSFLFIGYKLSEVAKHVDLLLFENTSPDNRVFLGNKDVSNRFNRLYEQFGTLDDTVC
jgi:hypothetical protein